MAEQQQKKYVDPNAFADYGAAMAPVAGNPMAVEWQKAAEAQLAAATTPKALAEHVWDAASAEALLAKVQGAYKTDPLTLTVIGAVSQYVMEAVIGRADGCRALRRASGRPGTWPCSPPSARRRTSTCRPSSSTSCAGAAVGAGRRTSRR